jgi:gliding motility-associated-like protein
MEAGEDPENPVDTDGDGMPDYMDLDSDGDGKSDEEEGLADCDGDGVVNYIDADDDCAVDLIFYGGISPNGDGHNDLWEIDGIWQFPNNTVQIYNRWGNLVFRASGYDNLNEAWYGQSNYGLRIGDQELPDGTYFYVVDLGDGSEARSGYIILKR